MSLTLGLGFASVRVLLGLVGIGYSLCKADFGEGAKVSNEILMSWAKRRAAWPMTSSKAAVISQQIQAAMKVLKVWLTTFANHAQCCRDSAFIPLTGLCS
ncbi:MAG: hypothetical protein H0T92_19960 [Pyrinomonadaceae bacterium]|nr:hypothetical protein [Pyrinomonadaceae bacterium]